MASQVRQEIGVNIERIKDLRRQSGIDTIDLIEEVVAYIDEVAEQAERVLELVEGMGVHNVT